MTILRRQSLGYAFLLFLIVVLACMSIGWLVWQEGWQQRYSDAVAQVETVTHIDVRAQEMVGLATGWNLSKVFNMILTDTWKTTGAGTMKEAVSYFTPFLDSLAALKTADENDLAAVESMRSLTTQHQQASEVLYGMAENDPVQAVAQVEEHVLPLAQQLESTATAFREAGKTRQSDLLRSLENNSTMMLWLVVGWTVVALAGGLLFSTYLRRATSRHLRAAVSGITSSASQLEAVSSQVAAGASQTAASTSETTATVEEVKQTAELAHEKANEVAHNSQDVARVAETGRATVEQTVAGIEQMQSQMIVVAETIHRLSEQAEAVGEIITTVNDLAEQSNLLSVNASIEAAKAGEQGKGFTVVAQEVKSLAEQSKQAVFQARAILSEIQKASTLAVSAADQGQEAVETGRRQSTESGEAIQALAESAIEAAKSATQISASSRQQLAGMEQISQAIDSINQASNNSVSGTRLVEQEVRHLQELADGLRRLVESAPKTKPSRLHTEEQPATSS
ncbi:MAG: chemotaxis protein [Actinobacteria bacterium]|nr:chemotaxis protein [Actinomycetota bacterium]